MSCAPVLLHDGSCCGCKPTEGETGVPLVLSPLRDTFWCVRCFAAYAEGRVGNHAWPVIMALSSAPIRAEQGIAGKNLLIDMSGTTLGLAALAGIGGRVRVVRCTCGCTRIEIDPAVV